MKFFSRKF